MSEGRRVLAVGLDAELRAALSPALGRAEFDLNQVPEVPSAVELARLIAFDVILIGFAGSVGAVEDLISAARKPGSPSEHSKLLLFARPAQLAAAESLLGRGVDEVFSRVRPPLEMQTAILRLLRVRPRLSTRVMARLTVRLGTGSQQFLCQTRNLSGTGMLAVTDNQFPVGTRVRFVLGLPESPHGVEGNAEVVRLAVEPSDPVTGLGLRFLDFRIGDEKELIQFLARHAT